jgi:hypothetical protein
MGRELTPAVKSDLEAEDLAHVGRRGVANVPEPWVKSAVPIGLAVSADRASDDVTQAR